MKVRQIIMIPWAEYEYYELEDVIANQYKAPLTAARYMQGLSERIKTLMYNADIYTDVPELSVEFGMTVKRINYKRIAIIYTIDAEPFIFNACYHKTW